MVSPAAAPNVTASKIVILEGENAVNSVGEKRAVAPVVEVRDRNYLPVSGVAVTFAIGGGRNATFANGASTMTVTTNATGRAVANGLSPLESGAVQIAVRGRFRGKSPRRRSSRPTRRSRRQRRAAETQRSANPAAACRVVRSPASSAELAPRPPLLSRRRRTRLLRQVQEGPS